MSRLYHSVCISLYRSDESCLKYSEYLKCEHYVILYMYTLVEWHLINIHTIYTTPPTRYPYNTWVSGLV